MQDLKKRLEQNNAHSWIELNKKALEYNIQELNKMRGPAVSLGFVVKANAYGHGLRSIVSMLGSCTLCSRFCVSTLCEALRLHGFVANIRVVSLVPTEVDLLIKAIELGIEIVVYSFDFFEKVCAAAATLNIPARVHIKLDTGLGRLGFLPDEVVDIAQRILKNRSRIILVGCMTHYADSGSADHRSMFQQREKFGRILDIFASYGIYFELYHTAASGGYAHMQKNMENFVRIGTLWTGIWKSSEQQSDVQRRFPGLALRPVLKWKTRVMQVKMLPASSAVGYFGSHVTDRPTRLLVLPVGYADGYPRELSNRGHVTIHGHVLPVVGIISMNMIAVDGTDCAAVNVGDEVLLMGGDGAQSATNLSDLSGAGALDLFTRLSDTLPRFIVEE